MDKDHPLVEDLKRKSSTAFGSRPVGERVGADPVPLLTADDRAAAPFVGILCEALDLHAFLPG